MAAFTRALLRGSEERPKAVKSRFTIVSTDRKVTLRSRAAEDEPIVHFNFFSDHRDLERLVQ